MSQLLVCTVALLGVCSGRSAPHYPSTETQKSSLSQVQDLDQSPSNYHRSYGDEGKADIGYSRQKQDKGQKGYQLFDSFHKKDGDSYAFEKHDSYGQDNKGDGEGAYSERKDQKAEKYSDVPHSESSDENEDDGESSSAYVVEDVGGPSGYDEEDSANYKLPAGYTYGTGEEYNFR